MQTAVSPNQIKQAIGGRPPQYDPAPPPLGSRRALRRRADGNVAAVYHGQHVLTPTAAGAWRDNTSVIKAAWWPFDLESGVRVTCDVGFLYQFWSSYASLFST